MKNVLGQNSAATYRRYYDNYMFAGRFQHSVKLWLLVHSIPRDSHKITADIRTQTHLKLCRQNNGKYTWIKTTEVSTFETFSWNFIKVNELPSLFLFQRTALGIGVEPNENASFGLFAHSGSAFRRNPIWHCIWVMVRVGFIQCNWII